MCAYISYAYMTSRTKNWDERFNEFMRSNFYTTMYSDNNINLSKCFDLRKRIFCASKMKRWVGCGSVNMQHKRITYSKTIVNNIIICVSFKYLQNIQGN